MIKSINVDDIDWDKGQGLVPALVQDALSHRVLMLGYMDRSALQRTIETGFVTFFSRSKNRLWKKGEESGNVLALVNLAIDCDKDALLVTVNPTGPTCHTGARSCFDDVDTDGAGLDIIAELSAAIRVRTTHSDPESYTSRLFTSGVARIAQKVGEEGVETALAAATKNGAIADEAADLLYHLLVLLEASDTDLNDVLAVLKQRAKSRGK